MPVDFCDNCNRQINGNARREIGLCRNCEKIVDIRHRKALAVAAYAPDEQDLGLPGELVYQIESQPVFDD